MKQCHRKTRNLLSLSMPVIIHSPLNGAFLDSIQCTFQTIYSKNHRTSVFIIIKCIIRSNCTKSHLIIIRKD